MLYTPNILEEAQWDDVEKKTGPDGFSLYGKLEKAWFQKFKD